MVTPPLSGSLPISTVADADAGTPLAAIADDLDIDESILEEFFKADEPWGQAVYRISYGDKAAWQRNFDVTEIE